MKHFKISIIMFIMFLCIHSFVFGFSVLPSPTIVKSFPGVNYNYWIPPDTMGAVGPNHCVEMINGNFVVYNKSTGAVVQSKSLNSFWSGHYTNYTFDPRIVYDKYAGRWYAISVDNPGHANNILFAYTDGADPTGTWHKFTIDADSTDQRWADYPHLGFDQNGVYITSNMFAISSGSTLVSVWAIPKTGVDSTPDVSNINSFENLSPSSYGYSIAPTVDYDPTDSSRPYYLVSRYNSSNLRLSQITWAGTSASLTSGNFVSIPTRYDPPDAHQPGGNDNIDTNDGRIINALVQNGKLWTIRNVKTPDGYAGAAWYKVDIPLAGNASLDEEGLIEDLESDIYYASIAVNESGKIGFGFTHSSDTEYASAYISGIDSDGTALALLSFKDGESTYYKTDSYGRNRWGDYSMTMVDPLDDDLFWSIQEYVYDTNKWGTYWVAFRVPEPATIAFLLIPLIGFMLMRKRKRVL